MMKHAGIPTILGQIDPTASSDLTRGITPNKPIKVRAAIPKLIKYLNMLFVDMTR